MTTTSKRPASDMATAAANVARYLGVTRMPFRISTRYRCLTCSTQNPVGRSGRSPRRRRAVPERRGRAHRESGAPHRRRTRSLALPAPADGRCSNSSPTHTAATPEKACPGRVRRPGERPHRSPGPRSPPGRATGGPARSGTEGPRATQHRAVRLRRGPRRAPLRPGIAR
ncbi:hypothetical protein EBESD8_22480 [Rhodococcus aetherivorans]|nr:hypothetical protein EBESD8_22480 [Rhodococcus aetherivorans]